MSPFTRRTRAEWLYHSLTDSAVKQNITLSLDSETLHQAKRLAAARNTSVSRLLAEDIGAQVTGASSSAGQPRARL